MTTINDQDLHHALCKWMGLIKNPYLAQHKAKGHSMKLLSNSPNAWIEFNSAMTGTLEIHCIHRLIEPLHAVNKHEAAKESQQFNSLMERVRLPVFMWEDKTRGEWQLRWQERIETIASAKQVKQLFDQSLYLANALQSRLGWSLGSRPTETTH